jgi:4-diphosphocytidyl-2-C-methyl-D-erythritol kinase
MAAIRARSSIRVRAFAKLNLTLRVLGVRADRYHELRTTFQTIALHDTLTFTPSSGGFEIECDDPRCPVEGNLIARAAGHLWRAAGRRGAPRGVHVRLRKRIPMEAGLGGGSSDAAAALRALAVLWQAPIGGGRLLSIARSIGADVAFFLEGGTMLGVERGDLLFRLPDWPPAAVVLACPPFGVSTRDAYGWFDAAGPPARPRAFSYAGAAVPVPPTELINDLEGPVVVRHPEIGRLVAAMRRSGAVHAAMTGSGSTVFGLFESPAAAARAVRVAARHADVRLTRLVPFAEYRRQALPRFIAARGPALAVRRR